jgi:hypothetical protein
MYTLLWVSRKFSVVIETEPCQKRYMVIEKKIKIKIVKVTKK